MTSHPRDEGPESWRYGMGVDGVYDRAMADMDWVQSKVNDPLTVIGGCMETVLLFWDSLDDNRRRKLLRRAHEYFEASVVDLREQDILPSS
jgi:hypothetical protein